MTRDKKDMNKYGKEWRYRYNRDYQLNAIEGLKRDREYVESQKRAWQEASKALPDDAYFLKKRVAPLIAKLLATITPKLY